MRGLLILFLLLASTPASAYCRQALILALDVSGSVNTTEYDQQIRGLATALRTKRIKELLLSDPESHVVLAAFEWSSQNHQTLIADWVEIKDQGDLRSFTARIAAHQRQRAGLKTAIGRALEFSQRKLAQHPDCLRHTIDVSGDGKNNIGPLPSDVYARSEFDRITVNALVVDDDADTDERAVSTSDMQQYFERNVIHGTAAFAEIAFGYQDYAPAIRRKLERELRPTVIGTVPARPRHRRLARTTTLP